MKSAYHAGRRSRSERQVTAQLIAPQPTLIYKTAQCPGNRAEPTPGVLLLQRLPEARGGDSVRIPRHNGNAKIPDLTMVRYTTSVIKPQKCLKFLFPRFQLV